MANNRRRPKGAWRIESLNSEKRTAAKRSGDVYRRSSVEWRCIGRLSNRV